MFVNGLSSAVSFMKNVKIFKLIVFETPFGMALKRALGTVTLLTTSQTINKIWHARLTLQRTKRQWKGVGETREKKTSCIISGINITRHFLSLGDRTKHSSVM